MMDDRLYAHVVFASFIPEYGVRYGLCCCCRSQAAQSVIWNAFAPLIRLLTFVYGRTHTQVVQPTLYDLKHLSWLPITVALTLYFIYPSIYILAHYTLATFKIVQQSRTNNQLKNQHFFSFSIICKISLKKLPPLVVNSFNSFATRFFDQFWIHGNKKNQVKYNKKKKKRKRPQMSRWNEISRTGIVIQAILFNYSTSDFHFCDFVAPTCTWS